uniref:AT-hook motif nuclear-localized protein n=1 Tax=Salix viminalis TaxID=40686 RepID=A0A6N2LFH5_SALVM
MAPFPQHHLVTDCMEEKNMIVSDQTPIIITAKDHDPPGNQAVHKVATGGSDHTLEPNNLGGGGTGCSGGSGSESVVENTLKRKRGRPRKHDVGANLVSSPPLSPPPGLSSSLSSCDKRGRGRPRGSGKLQLLASLETAGGSFTPHVVPVHTGEDIVTKILAFSQKGARAVCILSATGVVSSVIMRQPSSSGGIMRYDGPFEILSLSGSFTFSETGGSNRKNGMLSVSLAKPDGRVFGGGVAGSLIAAGPIQNIGKEIKRRQSADPPTAPILLANSHMVRVPTPIAGTTDAEDNCTTPTSALSEPRNEEAGNTIIISDQQANTDSENSNGQNVLLSQQSIPDQTVPPDANVGVPRL